METRTLGRDLEVSVVGMGCMGLSHAYGAPVDVKAGRELIAEAVDLGCTFFDTAEVYGTLDDPHHNEALVGEALEPYRDKVVIATKCGISFDKDDPKPSRALVTDARRETLAASLEGSLRRLRTDCIDLYYLHRVDDQVPIEDVADAMAGFIREGKISHWGISQADEDTIRRAHVVCPLTAVQNRYSMMCRDYEVLFGVLEELGIGFVAFSPLANGLLSGAYTRDNSDFDPKTDYRASMPQFLDEAFDANERLLDLIRTTARRKNATPAQVSLAWMIRKRPYIVPIPGTRRLHRLKENLGAADVALTAEEVAALDVALATSGMSEAFGGTETRSRQR